MRLPSASFKQLVFYGEVVGFLLAWAVGLVVTLRPDGESPRMGEVENFAATSDLRPGTPGYSNFR